MIIAQKILSKKPKLSDFDNLEGHKNRKDKDEVYKIFFIATLFKKIKVHFLIFFRTFRNHACSETSINIHFFMDEEKYEEVYRYTERFEDSDVGFCPERNSFKYANYFIDNKIKNHLKIVKGSGRSYILFEKPGDILTNDYETKYHEHGNGAFPNPYPSKS